MALVIEQLTMIYHTDKKKEQALQDIHLEIRPGEFVGILGRSGAGKSTLIRCINQLVKPTTGRVNWNGREMTKLSGKALRQARREMGMIFQQFHLIPRLTALQNCVLGCFGYRPFWKNVLGIISAQEKEQAMAALERVGIGHLAHKRVDQLSGGQQQRVAIARVMMQKPKLLLGDEPVASLDPVTSRQVMDLIKEIHHSEQMTTILNLHDVNLALTYCDRIIGLSQGHKVYDGSPEQVTDRVLERIYA
ncbi:phosphonate transport system ATP-binding protein [Caldalkalibacillus uzonensis]|uniref:Phosphonate transport system ATP-binding protein n=1 Tax=Caldalkalibacillus uzonensis TaxID=353224 RepID=A0ABU0CUR5_9BACI|nr:phosphonate ABC transporter ATP-binding protein [Caldalkalibacillus uzonensis]MDQ0339867.1 phosphonate transport system ATP-binding protein [Caldalkalibacillus uzonensis]